MTHRDAIRRLDAGLAGSGIDWAVTASANLALRGFPVEPGDVDVMTDADGVYRIADRFADQVIRPVRPPEADEPGNIRSHFGALELAGTEVELMGDVEHRVDGEWHPAGDVPAQREFVDLDGRPIPVMSLDHERRGYRELGRPERVALIDAGPR